MKESSHARNFNLPRATAAAVAAGTLALTGGCSSEKPESTCYTYQLGDLGSNVRESGVALLRDVIHYDGSMTDGTFSNLGTAAEIITSQLREQREASHSKSLHAGPLASDVVTLCIEPNSANDIREGGHFFVGPFNKAIDYVHDVPSPFNKTDAATVYTLPADVRPELDNLVPMYSTIQ